MEETTRWKRLVVLGCVFVFLGFITYFVIALTQEVITAPHLPLWVRVPQLMFPAFFLFLGLCFVFGLIRWRRREAALRAGKKITDSRREAMAQQVDALLVPALMTLFSFSMAASFIGLAFFTPYRPGLELTRRMVFFAGIGFLILSMILPGRLIYRKIQLGRFLPSTDAVRVDEHRQMWRKLVAPLFYSFCAIFVTYFARGPNNHRTTEQIIVVLFMWFAVVVIVWNAFRRREPKSMAGKSPSGQGDSLTKGEI
jgi:hypothetical protein